MEKKYKFDDKNHIHSFEGKPLMGTSTVCGVIAKPLTWWASGMAVGILGWTKTQNPAEARKARAAEVLEQVKLLDPENYLSLLDKAYRAHNEKKELSAEEGTDMHALLEVYVKECIVNNKGVPMAHSVGEAKQVSLFVDWALVNVKKFWASEVHMFSLTWWIGGVSDCVAELKDGHIAILDFKSAKEAYDTHFIQIAGYDRQLRENGGYTPTGDKILKNTKASVYIVFPFGAENMEPVFRYNTKQLRACFKSALTIYKLIKSV